MNNIARFNSGDKRLQVVVEGMDYEQKTLVQRGFFALGWNWLFGGDVTKCLDAYGFTNTTYSEEWTGGWCDRESMCDFPTTSFTELMILADMHTQEDVIAYLNEDELIKYGIKQGKTMNNNEFTKDMLKDGMFVMFRDQEDEHSKGYSIVLGKGFINEEGYVAIDSYDDNLLFPTDESFDVVEVFTSENLTWWREESFKNQLTSIWKRPSPEEVQRLSEKVALQEDIHAMKERLNSMESKLESM